MKKKLALTLFGAALAFGSGTVTPGARPGGNRCATSSLEGVISNVDVEDRTFSVAGAKNDQRKFKAASDTLFRIPGVSKDDLKNVPLSKVGTNNRVRVVYCTKDGSPVEVKVER